MRTIDADHRLKDILTEVLALESAVRNSPELKCSHEIKFSIAMLQFALSRWASSDVLDSPQGIQPEPH